MRTPPSTKLDSKFDASDSEPVPRTKTPTAPPPIPAVARTKTPTAPPALSPEEAKARREAEQDAEDARLRAEAVELAKKQAAARAAEQDKQAREAMDLAKRLAEAREKAQPPLATPDPDSVPITLATPDPDGSAAVTLFTPDPDESIPVRKVPVDVDGSMPVPLQTPDPDAPVDEEALWKAAEARARAAAADQKTMPVPKLEAEELIRELVGEKVTIKETNTSRVVMQEQMTIERSIQTARIASSAVTTVEKTPPSTKVTAADELFGKRDATPSEIDDEPSDGIVRHIPTVETKPQKRPPPPKVEIADDRPGDRTGEITAARKKHSSTPPQNVEPSILIEEATSATAADIAAAHKAVAAAAVAQVPAAKTADLAGSAADKAAGEVRKDAAAAFSDAEEAFFRQGSEKEKSTGFQMTGPVETFDDLDEDYKPVGFWDRLRGKKPEPKK